MMHACMHCILGESCSCMSSFCCLVLRERGARIRMCPPFPDRRQYNTTAAAKSLSRVLLYHERIVTFVLLAVQVQSKSSPSPILHSYSTESWYMSASVRRHRRLIHSVIVIVSLPWMYWYDSISNSNSNSNSMQTMCLCIVFILQIRSWNNEWFDSIRFDSIPEWMNRADDTILPYNQTKPPCHHATILTTTILTIQSINLQQSIHPAPPAKLLENAINLILILQLESFGSLIVGNALSVQ